MSPSLVKQSNKEFLKLYCSEPLFLSVNCFRYCMHYSNLYYTLSSTYLNFPLQYTQALNIKKHSKILNGIHYIICQAKQIYLNRYRTLFLKIIVIQYIPESYCFFNVSKNLEERRNKQRINCLSVAIIHTIFMWKFFDVLKFPEFKIEFFRIRFYHLYSSSIR